MCKPLGPFKLREREMSHKGVNHKKTSRGGLGIKHPLRK